ncbi:hypothetical protein [Actinomadura sp. 6N118]|uniref:hypothetical protein n=1 Tax=Actinomadura sp. 6N118 TaxID=3375151 RepID=UPI00379F7737
MGAVTGPRVREYQLYLLRTMTDAPSEMIDRALLSLGSSEEEMETEFEEISRLTDIVVPGTNRLAPVFDTISQILAPVVNKAIRQTEPGETRVNLYSLPMWPQFLFEVSGTAEGYLEGCRFVRAPGEEPLQASNPAQLGAWMATQDEVETLFGPLQELEVWPPFEAFSLIRSAPDGSPQTYEFVFSWKLLQSVRLTET